MDSIRSEQQYTHANLPLFSITSDSHDLLRLIDEIPLAVLILNNQGQIVFFNHQANVLFPQMVLGKTWVDIVAQAVNSQKCSYKSICLNTGQYLALKTSPIHNGKSQIIMLTDITAEEQLHAKLEHQNRLSDMGKMAGALAHQIRTPLASVVLYVKNLITAKESGKKLDYEKEMQFLTKMSDILDSMEDKIKDMLIFSKSQQISKVKCSGLMLIEQIAQAIASKSNAKFVLDYDTDELDRVVECNPILITDAVLNCIDNAIQANASKVIVKIKVVSNQFKIIIQDNGAGMSKATLEKIVEPFVTTRINGTGLGLSVVKMIAEAHAGSIDIHSVEAQGTEIKLNFPILGGKNGINAAYTFS